MHQGRACSPIPRSLRALVLHVELGSSAGDDFMYADVDIHNCFPVLLWNYACQELGVEVAAMRLRFLRSYVLHKTAWRQMVAETWGVDEKAAKKMLVALLHNGAPHVDDPLLWALTRDFR